MNTIETMLRDTPVSQELYHPTIREIRIFQTPELVSFAGAFRLIEQVVANPESHIGYATGNSMERMLEIAADIRKTYGIDFSRVRASHLDERYPIAPDHPSGFAKYVRERAVLPLGIPESRVIYWNGMAKDPYAEADRVEEYLRNHPVDFQLLGIGPPGIPEPGKNIHIAFVQQGTPFETGCHVVGRLGQETLEREKERNEEVPEGALTQGIATIARAKTKVLLAFGAQKGISLYHALYGPITTDCPASALQTFGESLSIYMDAACYESLKQQMDP